MATEDKLVREKLVNQGVGALTDAELVSIVIREGGAGSTAVGLAERLLAGADDDYVASVGSSSPAGGASPDGSGEPAHGAARNALAALARENVRKLRVREGLGIQKAAVLAAAFELGRRAAEAAVVPVQITSNEDVERIFRPVIASLPYEEFWVLFLSSANTVLDKTRVSQGGVSGTVVDHRLIVKRAIELLASGIILVHNHPSGVARPSDDDLQITRRVTEAAALFDISVLDHLIITSGACLSFRREGLIK